MTKITLEKRDLSRRLILMKYIHIWISVSALPVTAYG